MARDDEAPRHPLIPDHPADAFAGTAAYYARYRPPYPSALFDTLLAGAGIDGSGRLLDLACGTGQVSLPLAAQFREVWALDREPGMVAAGRAAAAKRGIDNVRWLTGDAENLEAPDESFELITVGNAFHRLNRREVGRKAMRWLPPGRCLAVLGDNTIWNGPEPWQPLVREVIRRWSPPPDHPETGTDQPRESFEEALRFVGFDVADEQHFVQPLVRSLDEVVGFCYSTSIASRHVLGDVAETFEADLRRTLLAHEPAGEYREDIDFYLILARRPDGRVSESVPKVQSRPKPEIFGIGRAPRG